MVNPSKYELVLNHFIVEVLERALGLGDRYTTMDHLKAPHNCNNAMVGSLIPNSIIELINKGREDKEIDEEIDDDYDESIMDNENDSYYVDVFLDSFSNGFDFQVKLSYWKTPTIMPEPYSLCNVRGPVKQTNPSLIWDEKSYHLPNNNYNKEKQFVEISLDVGSNEIIESDEYLIESRVIRYRDGCFQRITLRAKSIPLLYPIMLININGISDIITRPVSVDVIDEISGQQRKSHIYDTWLRTGRCQAIPLDDNTMMHTDIKEMLHLSSNENLASVKNNIFITPLPVFLERNSKSISVGILSMAKLYEKPFLGLEEIYNYLLEGKREDLVLKLQESVEFLKTDSFAIESLKALNLTYYNHFKNQSSDSDPEWKLFQWCYVLMAFSDIVQGKDLSDRFDFIGARTGGGKTEAYIAVTIAFGFYLIFKQDTPEALTLVRFPRRTLVIDQYSRAVNILSRANIILKYFENIGKITKRRYPRDYFTVALLLGNDSNSEASFSPKYISSLYPTYNHFKKKWDLGLYGSKGNISLNDHEYSINNNKSNDKKSFIEDRNDTLNSWTYDNLKTAEKEFKNKHDNFTPTVQSRYPVSECPLCGSLLRGVFNFEELRPTYYCDKQHHIHFPKESSQSIDGPFEVFMFRTDEELIRYRPTVVLGTLDKLPHIILNSSDDMRSGILGCFGSSGLFCEKHGYMPHSNKNPKQCCWNHSRGLIRGSAIVKCDGFKLSSNRSFRIIVHDEIHMFDDVVGGLSAPFERVILNKLGDKTLVIGMSATLSNVADVATNLCNRRNLFIFPPSFFFEDDSTIRRMHVGSLITYPREKRQYRSIHMYIFQVLLTWIHSDMQMDLCLERSESYIQHPLIRIEPVQLSAIEKKECINLLSRWIGYVNTKPSGEILIRDIKSGLEHEGKNDYNNRSNNAYGESNYPFYGYLSGDYPFEELTYSLEKFKKAIDEERIPRVLITTNIFSVGLDISKLNTMVFHGRPERMSEYVQSSSRIAREHGARGVSLVIFSGTNIRSKDVFSNFSRDLDVRYQLLEKSNFNPHSVGVIRETIHHILRLLHDFNFINLVDNKFTDDIVKCQLYSIYLGHLKNDNIRSKKAIDDVLKILETEKSEWSRLELIGNPEKENEEQIVNSWKQIMIKHPEFILSPPKILTIRSVGDQIKIFSRGEWEEN